MLYEYKCKECEHVFERVLKMSESDVPKGEPCPSCGHEGSVDRHYSCVPGLSYSSTSYVGDTGFQKHVLGPIMKGVPSHLRAETKYKVPTEI